MISFEEFDNAIKKLERYENSIADLYNYFKTYDDVFPDAQYCGSYLQDAVIRLLSSAVNPENVEKLYDFISWWAWELDFGKNFKNGDIIDARFLHKEIDISTTKSLYNYLMETKGEVL